MIWRRIGLAAGGALGLAVAVHGGLWWWAVATIERELVANLAAPPFPGWQASAGMPRRGGWPFAATVEVAELSAVGPFSNIPGDTLRWRAERFSVSLGFAHPRTLVVNVDGRQSLQAGFAAPVPFSAARLRTEVELAFGGPARAIAIDIAALQATLPEGSFGVARLEIGAAQQPAALKGESAVSVTVAAQGIALPPVPASLFGSAWPLGPAIERLLLDLVVTGPVPRITDLADRAAAWRDGGGAVALRRMELAWGEVTLSGGATLTLDGQLQPVGGGTVRLAGHAAALRALTAAGVLTPRNAMAAGAVLAMVARPPAGGGAPVVEVPLMLQNRTLAMTLMPVGRIPLVRVPELVWRPPQ